MRAIPWREFITLICAKPRSTLATLMEDGNPQLATSDNLSATASRLRLGPYAPPGNGWEKIHSVDGNSSKTQPSSHS